MLNIDRFLTPKFRIECGRMSLKKNGGDQVEVLGPGEIWLAEDGTLNFKIHAEKSAYSAVSAALNKPKTIGQLIPDEDFYTLEADEYSLPRWKSGKILPELRGGLHSGLVCGNLHEIVHEALLPVKHSTAAITLHLNEKICLPYNKATKKSVSVGEQVRGTSTSLNVSSHQEDDFKIEISDADDLTIISVETPNDKFTEKLPFLILHSLQFTTGRQLSLRAIQTDFEGKHTTVLRPYRKNRGRIPPPYKFNQFEKHTDTWMLFSKYLKLLQDSDDEDYAPMARHVNSVIESSSASLQASILSLTVAVEGLAGDYLTHLGTPGSALQPQIDKAKNALNCAILSADFLKRVNGALDAMLTTRNTDLLRAFLSQHSLDKNLYTSWSKLRHDSAHGRGLGDREIDNTIRSKDEVLLLFYVIIFSVITYKGRHTDYSKRGHPESLWPAIDCPPLQD